VHPTAVISGLQTAKKEACLFIAKKMSTKVITHTHTHTSTIMHICSHIHILSLSHTHTHIHMHTLSHTHVYTLSLFLSHTYTQVSDMGSDAIMNIARTSISSKVIGAESDFFATMAGMYVFMCVYVLMYVCVYVCMYVCVYVSVCVGMYVSVCGGMYEVIWVESDFFAMITGMCVHVCMYVCVCMFIHATPRTRMFV
jgi:hypothetical protein